MKLEYIEVFLQLMVLFSFMPQFSTSTNTYRNKLFYQKLVSVLTMKFLFLNSVKPQLTETLGE